jgi:hypothetical protein
MVLCSSLPATIVDLTASVQNGSSSSIFGNITFRMILALPAWVWVAAFAGFQMNLSFWTIRYFGRDPILPVLE